MNSNNNKNHVISVMVKDEAGIVSRVSGLFSGRGYSIESITAAQTSEKRLCKNNNRNIGRRRRCY